MAKKSKTWDDEDETPDVESELGDDGTPKTPAATAPAEPAPVLESYGPDHPSYVAPPAPEPDDAAKRREIAAHLRAAIELIGKL